VSPLPDGFGIQLDRSVRRFKEGSVLVGGHPGRLMTLSRDGVDALAALLSDRPLPAGARDLGGRLVEAGMAHPHWTGGARTALPTRDVTVVVPARDRAGELDRCLDSLSLGADVLVVDDASAGPESVTGVCARHGARVITRTVNGGPAAARNEALRSVDTELVAFVDSDCTVPPGWLDGLLPLFEDPTIGAVAPRIRPRPGIPTDGSALGRYTDGRSCLDLGAEPSEVGPERLVRYVPTAALVVRRSALPGGFDPDLRIGEDVDLVWRLAAGGWRVRYEPSVVVHHTEPGSWGGLLARRFHYGTSAGPLARRHGRHLAPVELRPWPTLVAAAVLTGRAGVAVAGLAASTVAMDRSTGGRGIPLAQALRWSAGGAGWTLVGIGRAATILAGPAVAAAALLGRRGRMTSALLVLTPPAVEWCRRRPRLDPVRWTVASVADDVAYGAGVWVGCLASRTVLPLVPSVRLSGASAPLASDSSRTAVD
jgi:mycofactocin system glycosyltransferase